MGSDESELEWIKLGKMYLWLLALEDSGQLRPIRLPMLVWMLSVQQMEFALGWA